MSEVAGITGSVTGDLVLRALDAASLRHQVHAANVANVSTEGWQRLQVSFEDRLAAAASSLRSRDDSVARRAMAGIEPRVEEAATGDRVGVDEEVAQMVQNSIRYQALLTALSREGALVKLALRDGRG